MRSTPSSDLSAGRRQLCDETARQLAEGEGLPLVRRLQALGILGDSVGKVAEPPAEAAPGPEDELLPISVWRPVAGAGDTVFQRPPVHPLGDHYADCLRIPARKAEGVQRVCLFGESAAAGYLLAPAVTPAKRLQERLENSAPGAFEVIDFARTNERLETMVTTVERSLQLDPDHLLLYTGNNWKLLETPELSPFYPSVTARQHFATTQDIVLAARRRWQGRALTAFARIAEVAAAAEVPITLVIPEVNLRDWEHRQPPTWLPGDSSRRWHSLYREAVEALETAHFHNALAVAREMLHLDGGGCPTAHRLAARALLGLGKGEEARKAAEAEVAAVAYPTLAFLAAPQACIEVQKLQRHAAERYGWKVVDLPRIFATHLGEQGLPPLPGSDLFLDYCHLSEEGISVLTRSLRRCLGRSSPNLSFSKEGLAPFVKGRVRGDLQAALHTAHRLLATQATAPLLLDRLRQGWKADPEGVLEALLRLAHLRTGPVSTGADGGDLSRVQGENLASSSPWLLQHGWRWDSLDGEMLRAILHLLREADHGKEADEIEARLLHHHRGTGVDLLAATYLWDPVERFFPEAMTPPPLQQWGIFRSPWPESHFCRVAAPGDRQRLELTARLPPVRDSEDVRRGPLRILLEGQPAALVEVGEGWSRHRILLPEVENLPSTLHRLTLRWPPLPSLRGAGRGEDGPQGEALQALEGGQEAELHPIFGEVAALRLTTEQP